MLYSIILACTLAGGIGYKNKIPWDIKSELYLFKEITTNTENKYKLNAIIMGRNTWESLLCKPLKDRINIIITSDKNFNKYDNVINFSSIDDAFNYCENSLEINKVFVIGGKSLYDLCLDKYYNNIENIYISIIYNNYKCDKYINIKKILSNFKCDINSIIFNSLFLHLKMNKKIKN